VEILGYLMLCLIWSTTWQAIRICLTGYPPLYGASLRFLIAAALLLIAVRVRKLPLGLPRGARQHAAMLVAGIVNGLGYALIYLAELKLSGGTTAIICASSPLFTLIVARLFGLEQLLMRRVAGMTIGLGGIAALFWDGKSLGADQFQAMLFALTAAALMWPIYGALLKRYASDLPALVSTLYFMLYTALTLLLLAPLRGEPLPQISVAPLQAHLALVFLAVLGSVVAWSIYLALLRRLDLSVLSTLGLVQPVLALGLDLVLREAQLGPRGYLGALLVLIAMGLSTWPLRR
jgi:drug/metabolite transporter (DMT)-like permease